MNPYLILGVPSTADDAEIRRAYLEAVRQSPPERDPERFQAVSHAYELVRNETKRLNYKLFDRRPPGDSPLDVLAKFCAVAPPSAPLEFDALKTYLRSCATK